LFGMSALSLWGISAIMGIATLALLFREYTDAVTAMIIAVSTAFLGFALLAAAVMTLLKAMGHGTAEKNTRLLPAKWHIPAAIFITALSLVAGSLALEQKYLALIILPILTLSGVIAPLWIIMSAGIRQMELGPRWRAWGIFGIGLTLGPLLMAFLEIAAAVVILIGIIIYFAAQPALASELMRFFEHLKAISDPEQQLDLLLPYLLDPAAIILVLSYLSLAIPIIEELLKPIGVWLFARQLKTPAAGFVMGILSGAAYAVVENLGAIAQAGESWTEIVIARAGAGLLHIANTGLMGWAIASLVNEKKVRRFLLTYIAVVASHGLWNSASVGLAIYGIAQELGRSYPWLAALSIGMVSILTVIFLAILIVSNRKFRAAESAAPPPCPNSMVT